METQTQKKSLKLLKKDFLKKVSFFNQEFSVNVHNSTSCPCLEVKTKGDIFGLTVLYVIYEFAEENNLLGSIKDNQISLFTKQY